MKDWSYCMFLGCRNCQRGRIFALAEIFQAFFQPVRGIC